MDYRLGFGQQQLKVDHAREAGAAGLKGFFVLDFEAGDDAVGIG
jgi:hypothetical protein